MDLSMGLMMWIFMISSSVILLLRVVVRSILRHRLSPSSSKMLCFSDVMQPGEMVVQSFLLTIRIFKPRHALSRSAMLLVFVAAFGVMCVLILFFLPIVLLIAVQLGEKQGDAIFIVLSPTHIKLPFVILLFSSALR
jgi:hypothetical protein